MVGFIFSTSWGPARHFSKSLQEDDFFKINHKLGENKLQFEGKIKV